MTRQSRLLLASAPGRALAGVLAAVLAVVLAVTGTVVLTAMPAASAAPASACSTSSGVLVVVDFRALGGNVQRGCDPSPTTGRAALQNAGFAVQDVQRQPGFVCRIDDLPSADDTSCVNTPPASAYWSYWHANAGQSAWSYSTLGASSYQPKPGSVDAWIFGATDTGGTSGGPCFSPADARAGRARSCGSGVPRSTSAAPRAPRTTPATSAPPSTGRLVDPPSRTPATSTGPAGSAPRSATSPVTGSMTTQAAPTTPATAATAATSTGASAIANASPAAGAAKDSGGSATPAILGALLAALLAAAAGYTALRRRRTEADGS